MQRSGRLPDDVFYYVDPPFFSKADRLYSHVFSDRDHLRLRNVLIRMDPDREPWLLSYDSLPTVRHLYGSRRSPILVIDRFYTTSRLTTGHHPLFAEAIVTNLPGLPEPRRASRGGS